MKLQKKDHRDNNGFDQKTATSRCDAISALSASRARISNVAASSAMICIEERGGKPEQAGPVQPHRRVDPVPAGPFAFRFRLGASFARVDRVRGVGGRLDIAVAQVAATYANLKRNNRIYFTRLRRYFSSIIFIFFLFLIIFVSPRLFPPLSPQDCLRNLLPGTRQNSLFRTCCVSMGMQPTNPGPHSSLLTQALLT